MCIVTRHALHEDLSGGNVSVQRNPDRFLEPSDNSNHGKGARVLLGFASISTSNTALLPRCQELPISRTNFFFLGVSRNRDSTMKQNSIRAFLKSVLKLNPIFSCYKSCSQKCSSSKLRPCSGFFGRKMRNFIIRCFFLIYIYFLRDQFKVRV